MQTVRYFPIGITSVLPGLDLRHSFVQQPSCLTCRRERQGSDIIGILEIVPCSIPSCSACTRGWVEGFYNDYVWSSPKRRVTALNMLNLERIELLKHSSCSGVWAEQCLLLGVTTSCSSSKGCAGAWAAAVAGVLVMIIQFLFSNPVCT